MLSDTSIETDLPPNTFDINWLEPLLMIRNLIASHTDKVEPDDKLVRILVLHLLDNALRHTRDKDPRRISVSGDARSGTNVIYSVRDNGCGLDAEDAKRVFAPFERSAKTGKSDGRGLGLAIAMRIVKRHGGRIWAEGIKGNGAAIYFTLGPEANDLPTPGQRV